MCIRDSPYVFDGSMSIEDFELMHRMMEQERREKMSEQFSILIDLSLIHI